MFLRAICPTTRLSEPKAVASRPVIACSRTSSMSAVTSVPSVMSRFAKTVGRFVTGAGAPAVPPPLPLKMITIPTNAMIARKTPMIRTNRLLRFKWILPSRVTGGTTVSAGLGRATIPKG
jgi:hypothetical protein